MKLSIFVILLSIQQAFSFTTIPNKKSIEDALIKNSGAIIVINHTEKSIDNLYADKSVVSISNQYPIINFYNTSGKTITLTAGTEFKIDRCDLVDYESFNKLICHLSTNNIEINSYTPVAIMLYSKTTETMLQLREELGYNVDFYQKIVE